MALMTCPKCGRQFYGTGCPDCDYPPTVPDPSEARRRKAAGILSLAVGIFIAVGFSFQRTGFSTAWTVLVAAGIFALAGVQLVTGVKGRVSSLMGGLVCIGFSALGFYVAF